MKKTKLKHLLLLIFAFAIWSCTEDYESDESLNSHNHNYSVKKYTYKQALKLQKFGATNKIAKQSLNLKFGKINLSKNGKNNSQISKDASSILAIDSTLIKEVSTQETTTYSMLVVLDSVDYSDGSFDNLVVKTDNQNNSEAFILHYTPTTAITYNADHKSYTFTGTTETSKVYGIYSFSGTNNNTPGSNDGFEQGESGGTYGSVTICIDVLKCNGTRTGGIGPVHNAEPGCTQTFVVTECSNIPYWNPYASGSGSSSELGLSDTDNIDTDPRGGTSSSPYNSNQTNTTTVMVVPHELYDETGDDCNLFTNLQSDFEVKSGIEYLKTQTNETIEKGICLSATGAGQYNPIVGAPDPNLDYAVGYDIPNGTVVDILIHTHYTGGLSIFSPDDLQQIYIMMKNPNITIPDNFTSIVVTPDNEVYAMTISSKASFLAFGDKWFPDEESFDFFRRLFYQSSSNGIFKGFNVNGNNSNSSNEINFLKMLGSKSGIKLYKANSDLSQWNNLKVNSINNSVTQTSPCN